MKETKIVVTERAADFHVQVEGRPGIWGCGRTIAGAIGDFVMNHKEMLGLDIQFPMSRVQAYEILKAADIPSDHMTQDEMVAAAREVQRTKAHNATEASRPKPVDNLDGNGG